MPMNKLRKIINYILHFKTSRQLLAFMHNGYLVETGWLQNLNHKEPIDISGKPIPWTTYSFIHFINDYLKNDMIIFEYGTGNSTRYYSARAQEVYAAEHDKVWFNKVRERLDENCTIYFSELNEKYEQCIHLPQKKFDLISIDGRRRVRCICEAIKYLKDDGIIVLDDSERVDYKEGVEFLLNKGFKKIDFWGISHRYFHNKATTIFFKHL